MNFDLVLYVLLGIPSVCMEFYICMKNYSSLSSKSLSKDRGTFIVIWLIIACSQMLSIRSARLGYGSKIIENKSLKYFLWIPLNIFLYLIGHLIRKQSIEQLGEWFTTIVCTNENQQLIDFGWYAKVRHPSYTGLFIYFLALALLLNNWLSLFVIIIPTYLVFLYRIHVEEQELQNHFGIKYEKYKQKVPYMIIPKIF
jgi:protein-S-isoprenylcysteine O-methyltransferase Ste14